MKTYWVKPTDSSGQSSYLNSIRIPQTLSDGIEIISGRLGWTMREAVRSLLGTITPLVLRELENGKHRGQADQIYAMVRLVDEAKNQKAAEETYKQAKELVAWNAERGYIRTAVWLGIVTLRAVEQMPNEEMRKMLYRELLNQWRPLFEDEGAQVKELEE